MTDYWIKGTENKEAKKTFFDSMDKKYSEYPKKEDDGDIIYKFGTGDVIIQGKEDSIGKLFLITVPSSLLAFNNTTQLREKGLVEKISSIGYELEVAE